MFNSGFKVAAYINYSLKAQAKWGVLLCSCLITIIITIITDLKCWKININVKKNENAWAESH